MIQEKALIWTACLSLAAAAGAQDRLETFDARSLSGQVVSVSADKVELTTQAGKQAVPRADVASMALGDAKPPPDVMATPGETVLVTVAGDVLPARDLKLAGDLFTFTNATLGAVKVRADQVAAIYPRNTSLSPAAVAQQCREMKIAPGPSDLMVVTREKDNWLIVTGVLKAIDGEDLVFRWKDEDRTVRVKVVPVILLADTGRKPAAAQGSLAGLDGTHVGFASLTLSGNAFAVDVQGLGPLRVPRASVARVSFLSASVADLAALKPAEVKEYGFLDRVFHYKANRSAGGGRLQLDGQTYASGLGLHSFCELTYDLGGAYSQLVAVVGIDDEVRPHGSAVLAFLGDGKPLDKPVTLTGKDKPQTVRLKLAGVRRLTIRADFGPDGLDVADHVDIAAARLIK